MHLADKAKW